MSNFFSHLKAINETKEDLLRDDPQSAKDYSAFMINKALSLYPDTIFFASEMNKFWDTPVRWQFDFYLHSVPKKKRFAKWPKKIQYPEDVALLAKELGYSIAKAADVIDLFTKEQMKEIRAKHSTGGR